MKFQKGSIPWNKGKNTGPRSEETKRKISEANKDQFVSDEWKRKVSKSMKNNKNGVKHGLSYTKEYMKQYGKKWRENNRDITNMYASRYKVKKRNQTPELTSNEKDKVILYYKVSQQLGPDWEVDHILPVSKGGSDHPDNLQVVTTEYNRSKSNNLNFRKPKALEYWRI